MTTTITIHADIQGAFWWPIGEPWVKSDCSYNVPAHLTLADALAAFSAEHDGDSSSGVMMLNGSVEITRHDLNRKRRVTRQFPLSMFNSAKDYVR